MSLSDSLSITVISHPILLKMPLHLSYHPRFHHYRSSTYFICIPRKQCLEPLQTYFPTTFADWDRRRERMSLEPDGHCDPRHEIFSPIHAINLARELHLGSILPAAFYNLARYGMFKTASGTEPLAHLVLECPSNEDTR
jgi:hypothetical protein